VIWPAPVFRGDPEGKATIPYFEIENAGGDLDKTMQVFERYGVPASNPDYLVSLTLTVKDGEKYYTYDWMPKADVL